MVTLLGALLRNESGGRNIPNVHQGTSSGQAQGYFQITEGTWNDFGGQKYAKNPLGATYEQQAEIASKIPLKRWDKSTLAAMQATGKQIDPNLTLGQNLAMHGESFGGQAINGGGGYSGAPSGAPLPSGGPTGQTLDTVKAPYQPLAMGAEAVPYQGPTNNVMAPTFQGPTNTPTQFQGPTIPPQQQQMVADNAKHTVGGDFRDALAKTLSGLSAKMGEPKMGTMATPQTTPAMKMARADVAPFDQNAIMAQRQQLAEAMQRLNSGKLWGMGGT